MKAKSLITAAALLLAGLFGVVPASRAGSFNEAQFTRLENEVKVLKENSAPHGASVGEDVKSVTSVATGANSRAELRFPDKSLTRLGANSRFTIRGDARTLDLDKGVMLLTVPNEIRGAKVRTAAVTAAVTGGTALIEYLPNGYVKLIVVEGTVDLSLNNNPSEFRTVQAGQMIIMDPNGKVIPEPVDVDLKRLLHTSKLLSMGDSVPNSSYVNQAVQDQQHDIKSGTLLDTTLVIQGLGTLVSLSNNTAQNLNGNLTIQNVPRTPPTGNNPPGNPGNPGSPPATPPPGTNPPPPPNTPAAFQGFLPLISGTTVLNENSTVQPDPQVTAFNSTTGGVLTSQGLVYHGETVDGPFPYFAFGSTVPANSKVQSFLNTSNGWGAFKFDSLLINGSPNFTLDQDVTDVLFAANGDITLAPDSTSFPGAGGGEGCASWIIPGPGIVFGKSEFSPEFASPCETFLTGVALYSQNGSITLAQNFSVRGTDQDFLLAAASISSDVSILGTLNAKGGIVVIGAGRDAIIDGQLKADDINVAAGQNITVDGGCVSAQSGGLILRAVNGIQITDSAQLSQMAACGARGIFRIEAKNGPVVIENNSKIRGNNIEIQTFSGGGAAIDGVQGGNITVADSTVSSKYALKARTQAANGALTLSNSTLKANKVIQLFSTGSDGIVEFTQDVTLNGKFLSIAGTTVEVDPGVTVTIVNQHSLRIFATNQDYNGNGYGNFQYGENGTAGKSFAFANHPKFRGPRFFFHRFGGDRSFFPPHRPTG